MPACGLHLRGAVADQHWLTLDGNEAAASIAYRSSEVISIYPITPASPMGELADEWAMRERRNVWGAVPVVTEMQSEGGAAGVVHGALQAGALTTTFTASQGLLLMLPNLYKIAGELTSFCMHVAARTVATHALSIFCDHSDVMACRGAGLALLGSASVQEAHDLACIAHAATLRARVPFLHFFDGFRTSHELTKIRGIDDATLRAMLDPALVDEHRARALSPNHPVVRGTAQNPDVFFQAREACNPAYDACPDVVSREMQRFAELTGRKYRLFDYAGHPEAERVIVSMGSSTETVRATVEMLAGRGERVGAVAVRLYRPFDVSAFVEALPATVRRIAVLDRTKEPGSVGEPLYLDVVAALSESWQGPLPMVTGGRYGLSSKELSPSMVAATFEDLAATEPRRRFTLGIVDDVTQLSLGPSSEEVRPDGDTYQAVFYGLGSDGTVGANKNTIKIVSASTDRWPQGYFVYDSKKSGAVTTSHLRFGSKPITAPYLIEAADLVGCHQFDFLDRYDVVERAKPGGTLLLNSPHPPGEVWDHLSRSVQEAIVDKGLRLFVVDAYRVARDAGLGGRINTVMQVCFFAVSKILPVEDALGHVKRAIEASYGRKGGEVVRRNLAAVDTALSALHEVEVPGQATSSRLRPPAVPASAPDFVRRVTGVMLEGKGDHLPVSAFAPDGTWPVGTARWEKRNIAHEIPTWDAELCIQCNKCVLVCPHAAIRAKVYDEARLADAPEGFLSTTFKAGELAGGRYTIQVAPEDCTGCRLCAVVCPAKDKSNPRHRALDMVPQRPRRDAERARYDFFLGLPEVDRRKVKLDVKQSQLLEPLFEYSGACAGCGETPYIKLLSQLFGDRAMIANATGCSSIYGGNLPTTPYTTDSNGRGPAWSNSLFEDNAEFGLGFRLAVDANAEHARDLLRELRDPIGHDLVDAILGAPQDDEAEIMAQRARVDALRAKLESIDGVTARRLDRLAEYLLRRSVWLVGGDGWAYDIGFGGLDHVLASRQNVNVLVLDTEVYSNTGGQQSKATPLGAAAKFAVSGKATPKKDLGLIAMAYGHVYVAQVAFGARDAQTLRAFVEADQHPGPSLIVAYSHCIAHGYDLMHGCEQQKLAVDSGVWPLYRFDPSRTADGKPPLHLDSGAPKRRVADYMQNEARFRMVEKLDRKRFERLGQEAERQARRRTEYYRQLAAISVSDAVPPEGEG